MENITVRSNLRMARFCHNQATVNEKDGCYLNAAERIRNRNAYILAAKFEKVK